MPTPEQRSFNHIAPLKTDLNPRTLRSRLAEAEGNGGDAAAKALRKELQFKEAQDGQSNHP